MNAIAPDTRAALRPGSEPLRACRGLLGAWLAAAALLLTSPVHAQTVLLSETFEPSFPAFNGWTVGDSNATSGLVYWDDVNTTFGTVAAHNGNWMGYCAGIGYLGPTTSPRYTNHMQAVMTKTLNFAGYTGANLEFWFAFPTGDPGWDFLRVYIDVTNQVFSHSATNVTTWRKVTVPLSSYVGGSHSVRFEFFTDTTVLGEGAYIDDIAVRGATVPVATTGLAVENANYSGYVLDSDTFFARSNLSAQATFNVENFTGGTASHTNVLSYRLINASNGVPHPIYGFGNTATNAGYVYNITNVLSLVAGTNFAVTNVASIRPAAWMDQFVNYYLECRLLTNGVLAQVATSAPERYHHFTNTLSSDPAFNVLVTMTNAAWSRTYAVQPLGGQDSFQVDVDYEVRRWDDLGLGIATANVPVVLDYTLRDQAGTVVPLAQTRQTFFESVDSYGIFFFTFPNLDSFTRTLNVRPSVQLDSVAKQYYLTVTIAHTNNPGSGQVITANTLGTSTNQLLHFNGKLLFGAVGTTMTGLAGTPPHAAPSGGGIPTTLSSVDGFVTLKNTHTYTGAGPLGVSLRPNGDALVTGGFAALSGPSPDDDSVARLRFQRGAVTLTPAGGTATFKLLLPAGLSYRLTDIASPLSLGNVQFGATPLNAALAPAVDLTYAPGGSLYVAEESKPVWLESSQITWRTAAGKLEITAAGAQAIHVRQAEYNYLGAVSNLLVNPLVMGDKKSNDKYWRTVNGASPLSTIETDPGSNATLNTTFDFGPGGFRTHFPYDSAIQWTGAGGMVVQNDLVTPGAASTLASPGVVRTLYTRDCPGCGAGGVGAAAPGIVPTNSLSFTRDGGIVAGGPTLSPVTLEWGYISTLADYAQRASNFVEAAFHMPGPFLRGDQNLLPDVLGPATILYTGFAVSNLSLIERPASPKYKDGFADYAGLNFRALADGAHRARSTIAGQPNITWDLEGRSKYYVRYAGVTGIHEAVPGTFPSNLTLWGYDFTFTGYGLSYLDSQNKDSITDGTVSLPYPSDFDQDFEKMTFSCLGAPLGAEVPSNDPYKLMSYWTADFKTLAITFKTKDGCDPTEGYLVLGIQGHASHFEKPIYGSVGFFAGGDHIPKSFNLEGVDSRLKAPNVFKFAGPNSSTYTFTPVSDVYYNTWSNRPSGSLAGWCSLFGKLDLPFFEDMQLHLQTSCRTNGVASSNAPIHLSGGWPRAGTSNPNHGWLNTSGHTPFQTNYFDWHNAGWPGAGGGLTLEKYRDNDVEQYHPRAQRLWLGVIEFDYPMSWNSTLRSFTSWQERTNDLLVLQVRHQCNYMDAKQAEINFGAEYDGLPSVSLVNIAFNAIDEATGVGSALVKAATQPISDVLTTGLDEVNQLLDTQMNRVMDGVFDRTIDPIIDNWYGALSNQWAGAWNGLSLAQKQQFLFSVQTNATNFFIGGAPGAVANNMSAALRDIGSAVNDANNLIRQVEDYLRDATNAICAVVGTINMGTNGAALGSNVVGLIAKEAGERVVVPKLVQSLVGELAGEFVNAVAGQALEELTKEIEPTLTQITDSLNQVKDAVAQVHAQLDAAGEFTSEIDNTIKSLSSEMTNVSIQVSSGVNDLFGELDYTVDNPFQHLTADEVKKYARQKVEDQFFATSASAQVQTIFRQRLYDLDAAMREQIDTVFAQLNGMMRDLISQSLAELDNSINKALGDVGDSMGAGKIDGHALIVGDSLKCLRIDAHFEWKAPDSMEFNAFLQIKELDSDGTPGCSSPSGTFTEVTLGATEIPFDWISPDLTASISVKFTFDGTVPFPVNFAGQVELNGDLSFEAFVLYDLAAAVAFGKYENYIALKGGVKFNGYDFSGAIFFGRTCSLDPILLIDPDVAEVLGSPPFTGAYVYAQGWLPISELVLGIPASCIFQISAGIGAGAFYFVEGPTYGGKMYLGVSGDLLCLVSIMGEITMVGVKTGDDLRFKGKGHFEAEIGPCPFCISISKDVSISFINKKWKFD